MVLEYGKPNSVTLDHVVPKSKKGKTKVAACFDCNSKKSDKPLIKFLGELYKNDYATICSVFHSVGVNLSDTERLRVNQDNINSGFKGLYLGKAPTIEPPRYTRNTGRDNKTQYRLF